MSSSYMSRRAQHIPFSSIRQVFEEARRMEGEGIEVARMEIGRPDFDTPNHIKEAAITALNKGLVHYAPNKGIADLRHAIADKLLRDNNVVVDPETGVLVTVGCKEAIFLALCAYLNPGDEVIVPDPCWDTYAHTTSFLDGVPVALALRQENGYQPDLEELEAKITKRSKILVIVSPHNPTGGVYSRDTLAGIAEVAQKHDLLVISDEIYEKLTYAGTQHLSIASLPNMAERTIVINGFSKAYAMDGWRLGYAAGPEVLIRPMLKVHQYTTNCVATFAQWGAVAAYTGTQEPVEEMRRELDRRRIALVKKLRSIDGVVVPEPVGAFYVFPRFEVNISSDELASYVLREAQVACIPGSVFGELGEGHLRLSYATSYDSIIRGVDRLRLALERLTVDVT